MDWTSIVYSVLCVTVAAVLISSSVSDVRSREISDKHWVVIGAVGIVANLLCSAGSGMTYAVLGSVGEALFLIMLLGDHGKLDAVMFVASLLLAATSLMLGGGCEGVIRCAAPVLFSTFFLVMYWLGIIRGGADTKCLIVCAMAVPVYPEWVAMTDVLDILNMVFAPSVAMMFIASIMSVACCSVYCSARSLSCGSIRFNGYRLPVTDVGSHFVWPMEDIEDGKVVRCAIPEDKSIGEICTRFERAGVKDILVTPMVPFLVPLTVAFVMIMVLGSPFTLLC
ncbi:MAG: hypothetical protein MJZ21_00370 [archaeon]|nr:hypothetical protein [archaeon]